MLNFPVASKSKSTLIRETNAAGGEAIPFTLYDTATYVSGTTTALPFFNAARANQNFTNLETPGQLQSDQWFEIWAWGLTIVQPPSASAWADAALLIHGAAAVANAPPTWTFELSNKNYGPYPLYSLHALGGITGFGLSRADTTAATLEYANNGYPGQPAEYWQGSIIIPPQQNFRVTLNWDGAVTLTGGDTLLQVWSKGVMYRRVV